MRHVIESLPAELWAAYSVALADHRDEGAWPDVPRLARLAERFDTCPWALLVLTRAELPQLDRDKKLTGELVRFDDREAWSRPTVLAPTPDALVALYLMASGLYADVVDPWGRSVEPRRLHQYAEEWTVAAHRASPLGCELTPYSIEPPPLPLQAEH